MSNSTNNALVMGNTVISFAGVSDRYRNDLMDLFMYAHHRATQTFRPDTQWTSWIDYYRNHLTNKGCRLDSILASQPQVIGSSDELGDFKFGVKRSAKRTDGLMELARRSFRSANINAFARRFFESGHGVGQHSSFQIIPCEATATDDISFMICALHASASATAQALGGDSWIKREMVVRLAGGVYNFNGPRYDGFRAQVQARLTEVGRFNIQRIEL